MNDFSETGYEKVIKDANEMCEKLEIESEFKVNRKRRTDQRPDVPEGQFQRIFSSIIEKETDSIEVCFESLKKCMIAITTICHLKACRNLEGASSYDEM